MNTDEHQDRLVDMLLWELVGEQTPPDVRKLVLGAVDEMPRTAPRSASPLVSLPSAKASKLPVLALAAMVTLLGVAGALIHLRNVLADRTPVLTMTSGAVNYSAGRILPGESLVTGVESKAVITYRDGTVVELAPETTLIVSARSRWDRSKGIELVAGKVQASVQPQRRGKPMVLSARDAGVEVLGTGFTLECNEERTRLEVTEGTVRFDPQTLGEAVRVEAGYFAEAGKSGFQHGVIPVPPVRGIRSFTLMNADTDEPIREKPLVDGETISLSSLSTPNLNIRADFEGEPPVSVKISLRRHHGKPTGLKGGASKVREYPPFFVAGDHWAEGRPYDCAAWVAPPGYYHLSAEAFYADEQEQALSQPLKIKFWFTK